MEFYHYVFETMRMIIVISAVMVQWFGVIACLKWIWKNWFIIVVIVTWNVIASLGWIWKSRFSYMVETPQSISEDNQEPVDVDAFASLPPSSAESSAPRWKHDVFLSFRGVDTRGGITFEIYDRLQNRRGIKTFMDDQDLQVGDVISPTLLMAIKESRFAIIALSPNYASSTWCLEELRNICECMKEDNNRILPLFYNVDPSDVRNQKRSFGDAFTKHEKSGKHKSEKVQQWRDALTKVANFSGWHTLNYKTDRELVDAIEESVCNKLRLTEPELKMCIGGFNEFAATKQAIDKVMNALKDDEATTIGVYGMGGVGKTTMVKYVGAQAQKSRLFNQVIMAVVSQNPDLIQIQETFAEMLDFKLEEKTEIGRAIKLKEKIMRGTGILIILDDIWKRIEFSRIGIPNHNELLRCNSKVLLTTRRSSVCQIMESHAKIRLNILSKEDSWSLFVKEARKSFDKSSNFYDVAREVVRECAGLPIALIAVARALRDEALDGWKEAARRLQVSQPPNPEDEGDVFKCIKLSYDYLKYDDSKSCFLLCCLFPEDYDIPIEYLLMYGIGKGMFQDSNMLEARATTYLVVKALKDSSLLLDARAEGCVRMHDVIRDMAILMTSLSEDGQRFLVKVGFELKNWPKIDARKGYSAISLMHNNICKLPEELVCPNLQILLLQYSLSLHEIPKSFFRSQNELRVLDLSYTCISLLPQSISFLTNLQALYLDYCLNIIDISVIGKLHKLEILSMRGNSLRELPREIGQLTKLGMLDVSAERIHLFAVSKSASGTSSRRLGTIPSKVISKLDKLEELYMQCGFWDWGSKIDGKGEETNISFDELAGLSYLSILKVCISDANCIPKSVKTVPNWVYFDISICSDSERQRDNHWFIETFPGSLQSGHNCRSLSFDSTDTTIGTFPDWFVNVVVKNTERLSYRECRGLINILVEFDRGRLHGLKVLSVQDRCENLKELMNAITCVPDMPVFKNLEKLYLENLDDLKQLCVGELPFGSLCSLKLLRVFDCRNLGNVLLPSKLLQKLPNLEKLLCKRSGIESVFGCEGFEPEKTNLREMELQDLYEVRRICNGPAPRGMFQTLKKLDIDCGKFQGSLFTFDVAQCLFQLEDLHVSFCPHLERVIEARRETVNSKKTVLPKLKNLCLQSLPMLYEGSATIDFECPSLENLVVFCCPHLSFPSSASDYFHSRNQVIFSERPKSRAPELSWVCRDLHTLKKWKKRSEEANTAKYAAK
ncbi:probable disease resistance protein At4g27220 [Rosa chinensis]|uniref:probable disease resistance protein At4g27220 n=1 Tax=Rosa chinensis TaxID=74649 RepID=UPI000D0948B2|nr:probable disease resistance protein At4g27220 [Rosa chinensis]XP_024188497.1 probable disease resistance protein At4g27220 [Rosa chinensis]XP_024188499.1 probable disease resistance protein At4g27220 [Rosa chinensis]XP_024188503.1 probable disease resistance protein At4g27220 [Rosa chinensis]XP_040371965.1 probable disease resistance protein At4g27220 [Rosa chinensis]XP_040371966.1 probable disease resistance protein At4g27220 [Rosa chinensis]XP_040371967.1 probable disease resistance prot